MAAFRSDRDGHRGSCFRGRCNVSGLSLLNRTVSGESRKLECLFSRCLSLRICFTSDKVKINSKHLLRSGLRGGSYVSRYRYEELSTNGFEDLVVDLCRVLLGKSAHGFAEGRDGGRDVRFDGVTNDYPSARAPWAGSTVIQSKHVSRPNASYSDSDFNRSNGVLDKEILRIRRLVDAGELDHYMMFANRKLSGGADSAIRNRISSECGLDHSDIQIIGVEEIDRLLREHKEIAERHGLDLLTAPLRVTRDGLAEVIEAMHVAIGSAGSAIEDDPVRRTSLERKNELNQVSSAEIEPLRKRCLKDTKRVEDFLSNPMNRDLLEKYNEAVDELNCRLPYLISQTGSFMGAWHKIYDIMTEHEEVLRRHRRLAGVVQFYMYWNCDFGRREDDGQAE